MGERLSNGLQNQWLAGKGDVADGGGLSLSFSFLWFAFQPTVYGVVVADGNLVIDRAAVGLPVV